MSFYERIFENSGLIREHTKEEKRNNIYLWVYYQFHFKVL